MHSFLMRLMPCHAVLTCSEIFESTKADFATAKALSVDRMKGYVVRLRGLPFSASATDGKHMMEPWPAVWVTPAHM
jgi:hypothetical protein